MPIHAYGTGLTAAQTWPAARHRGKKKEVFRQPLRWRCQVIVVRTWRLPDLGSVRTW